MRLIRKKIQINRNTYLEGGQHLEHPVPFKRVNLKTKATHWPSEWKKGFANFDISFNEGPKLII